MITFENYNEEYLDEQVELVLSSTREWTFFNYPTSTQLKQTYANENFTQKTRHYAFEEQINHQNKMVGFVSTAVENKETKQASLQFPFVHPDYEQPEQLRTKLLEKAISTLKEEGATHILSNIPTTWDNANKVLLDLGFEKKDVTNSFFMFGTDHYDFSAEQFPEEITLVDAELDKEELVRVFSTEMAQTPEEIGAMIDNWKNIDTILLNVIAKKDGKIISHSMVLKGNENNKERVFMTHVSIYDDQYIEFRDIMAKYVLNQIKNKGFKQVNFIGIPEKDMDLYRNFNFPTHNTVQYRRDFE